MAAAAAVRVPAVNGTKRKESEGTESSDGEGEPFPELDPRSDTVDEEDEEDNDPEDESDEEEEDSEEDEDDEQDPDARLDRLIAKYSEKPDESDPTEHRAADPRAPKIVQSDITGFPKKVYPDIDPVYDSDSSTEEDPNRIGNVPLEWYDDLPHIGYDIYGKRVLRPAKGDELDKFLATVEDPTSWSTAVDKRTGAQVQLSPEELDIIGRLARAENPDAEYDPYEPMVEWFTGPGKERSMPLSGRPEPKGRFVPSKWEHKKVMKIVRAIRQGKITPHGPAAPQQPQFYALWNTGDEANDAHPPPLVAPKVRLPTHSESYNPPKEYLPTDGEKKEWEAQDPSEREEDYLPRSHDTLRQVPGYDQFISERYSRQLDLYLAPRVRRVKLNIDPESLVPHLPSVNELRPFPIAQNVVFPHQARVRAVSWSMDGTWLVTGDEAGTVRCWEAEVGKCVWEAGFEGPVGAVEWCPKYDFFLIAHLAWHNKGDYFASVAPDAGAGSVYIHQVTRHSSQSPFNRMKGSVQLVSFHPRLPHFFVATQRYVRQYDLANQRLVRTLHPGLRWISSLSLHPSGQHLLVGSYDRKLAWFDLEMGTRPFKVLRYHSRAIRGLAFSPHYPLFATASDDGTLQLFHATVYADLMQDPRIVPLKILRGHEVREGLGVLGVRWHPRFCWCVSVGADGNAVLWAN
ncbi:BOP1NT-domain-containing protein [Dacryopinax primogenitus]|uniref:Ribosome biogenesis protein ERB1 n=1 Tax=Dacryopinax primogenitus (strain DJM 731) TaxID=1858805 RepID=M5FRN6_DACPD|nr:BOP1NT-domain-containing protein [Dacryopinax primogenitus]EJT97664.1 BOP1NT-domain-containing protein [Dacryopinax primogenitus]